MYTDKNVSAIQAIAIAAARLGDFTGTQVNGDGAAGAAHAPSIERGRHEEEQPRAAAGRNARARKSSVSRDAACRRHRAGHGAGRCAMPDTGAGRQHGRAGNHRARVGGDGAIQKRQGGQAGRVGNGCHHGHRHSRQPDVGAIAQAECRPDHRFGDGHRHQRAARPQRHRNPAAHQRRHRGSLPGRRRPEPSGGRGQRRADPRPALRRQPAQWPHQLLGQQRPRAGLPGRTGGIDGRRGRVQEPVRRNHRRRHRRHGEPAHAHAVRYRQDHRVLLRHQRRRHGEEAQAGGLVPVQQRVGERYLRQVRRAVRRGDLRAFHAQRRRAGTALRVAPDQDRRPRHLAAGCRRQLAQRPRRHRRRWRAQWPGLCTRRRQLAPHGHGSSPHWPVRRPAMAAERPLGDLFAVLPLQLQPALVRALRAVQRGQLLQPAAGQWHQLHL